MFQVMKRFLEIHLENNLIFGSPCPLHLSLQLSKDSYKPKKYSENTDILKKKLQFINAFLFKTFLDCPFLYLKIDSKNS